MASFEIIMPKLGESIIEATITKWLVSEGDTISEEDPVVEIATDKVDSEIPSPVDGTIKKLHYKEGDTVAVGAVIALVDMEGEEAGPEPKAENKPEVAVEKEFREPEKEIKDTPVKEEHTEPEFKDAKKFYSPLVKSIAREEQISVQELNNIKGSGKNGRVNKKDVLQYLEDRASGKAVPAATASPAGPAAKTVEGPEVKPTAGDEIVEMDRMRKLIADHMVMSKHTSPHVTMFHEVDMTRIVNWRNQIKDQFYKREGEKLTFTPIFIESVAKALREFPLVNSSVDNYTIIKRKNINIGMATALPNGNLIVPVIANADRKNLVGLAKDVNDLANRARNNKLNPDEIQGGPFTITNFGQFGNLTGAPIINQPQVAILGVGTITKKPVVIESSDGDMIGIRHMMILSLAFDHRIVDGALGGMFLQKIAKILENFDTSRTS